MADEGQIESAIPPKGMLKVVNPIMRFVLRSPLHGMTSGFMMLLAFKGRKTGRDFLVPVSYHMVDGVLTTFSGAPWVRNLRDNATLHVIQKGERRPVRAEIIDDPDQVARAVHQVLTEIGAANAHQFAFKVTGSLPPPEKVREALAGRVMIRLHPTE